MIEKLDLKLPEEWSEKTYNSKKSKYIAEYTEYIPGSSGGLFGSYKNGYYKNNPVLGEAKWNSIYPDGFKSWISTQEVSDIWTVETLGGTVNEIIDYLNKIDKYIKFKDKKKK